MEKYLQLKNPTVLTKKTSLNGKGKNSMKLNSNQIYLDYPNKKFSL